jgi:hypothetical protein
MNGAPRDMPVIRTAWGARGYELRLPGNVTRYAMDRQEARAIVARELPFTSLDFVGDPPARPGPPMLGWDPEHQ